MVETKIIFFGTISKRDGNVKLIAKNDKGKIVIPAVDRIGYYLCEVEEKQKVFFCRKQERLFTSQENCSKIFDKEHQEISKIILERYSDQPTFLSLKNPKFPLVIDYIRGGLGYSGIGRQTLILSKVPTFFYDESDRKIEVK